MTTSEAVLRVCVVGAGAQDKPATPLPLAQTEGPTSASPGQGNPPDTSGPRGKGLAQGLKAGAARLGHSPKSLDSKAGVPSVAPLGAVQKEGCCER